MLQSDLSTIALIQQCTYTAHDCEYSVAVHIAVGCAIRTIDVNSSIQSKELKIPSSAVRILSRRVLQCFVQESHACMHLELTAQKGSNENCPPLLFLHSFFPPSTVFPFGSREGNGSEYGLWGHLLQIRVWTIIPTIPSENLGPDPSRNGTTNTSFPPGILGMVLSVCTGSR